MDQIEESGEDSQAPESTFEDDLVPKEITDEFFEELCSKANLVGFAMFHQLSIALNHFPCFHCRP